MSDSDPAPEDLPTSAASTVPPEIVRSSRSQLTPGADVIDVAPWAGSVPQVNVVAPRVRVGRSRWFNFLLLLPIAFLLLIVAVAVAKGLRETGSIQHFISRYPGTIERSHPTGGLPAWVRWQHFFNLFFMVFIIRSGLQILSDHPRLYWTRHSTPGKDWFRIQKPVPADPLWTAKKDSISLPGQVGLPGIRHSIGLARWWHLGVDVLWLSPIYPSHGADMGYDVSDYKGVDPAYGTLEDFDSLLAAAQSAPDAASQKAGLQKLLLWVANNDGYASAAFENMVLAAKKNLQGVAFPQGVGPSLGAAWLS